MMMMAICGRLSNLSLVNILSMIKYVEAVDVDDRVVDQLRGGASNILTPGTSNSPVHLQQHVIIIMMMMMMMVMMMMMTIAIMKMITPLHLIKSALRLQFSTNSPPRQF